jgi:rhamnogalacturonyl hydrolase YesR
VIFNRRSILGFLLSAGWAGTGWAQTPGTAANTTAANSTAAGTANATAANVTVATVPTPAAVLQIMEKVADWQLANPSKDAKDGWIYGAFYTGVMALNDVAADKKYHDAMVAQGQANGWKPAKRIYMADDHAVTQMYLELYLLDKQAEMIGPTRERFDFVLANPKDDDLDFSKKGASDKWSWCDSLFMDPPAWARLSEATGDKRYLDSADRRWWVTAAYLYDKDEHLFYRDSRFFTQREPNGQKIFWARGNGWVMAGLVRMLEAMPKDYPDRAKYAQLFTEMAAKIKSLQQPDGLWRPGLLDPVAHPQKETSGSGFFTYALAWGVNQGLLDRATYEPVVLKAWDALTQCVQPDGKLIHVQPVGDSAKGFAEDSTTPYGPGAFLLAGSGVYRMVGGK